MPNRMIRFLMSSVAGVAAFVFGVMQHYDSTTNFAMAISVAAIIAFIQAVVLPYEARKWKKEIRIHAKKLEEGRYRYFGLEIIVIAIGALLVIFTLTPILFWLTG